MKPKLVKSGSQKIIHTSQSSNVLSASKHSPKLGALPPIGGRLIRHVKRSSLVDFAPPVAPVVKETISGLRRYTLMRTIGTGSFARVRLAIDRVSGAVVVIKIMSKDLILRKNQLGQVHRETVLLKEMHSPFIVSPRDSFQDEYFLYLVLEYAQGGELYQLLSLNGHLDPVDARIYASEVVCALSHFHSHNTVYRDLKPENILLTSTGHIKVADLGFAKKLDKFEQTFSFCGTPEYIAPEVIERTGHSFPGDWWQFGVLVFEMLVGHAPYQANSPFELYEMILTKCVYFPPDLASDALSLISDLLIKDPLARATEEEVRTHPYFEGVVWDDVERLRSKPSYRPKIRNPLDSSNFDQYKESDMPQDVRKSTNQDLFRDF